MAFVVCTEGTRDHIVPKEARTNAHLSRAWGMRNTAHTNKLGTILGLLSDSLCTEENMKEQYRRYIGYVVSAIPYVVAITIASFVLYYFYFAPRMAELAYSVEREKSFLEVERAVLERAVAEYEREEESSLLEQKKQKFLATAAVSFIYVDNEEITDFYNMTFKEPTVTEMVEKLVETRSGEIVSGKAAETFLKSELAAENLQQYIKTIKLPETTLPEMFLRYQRHILENNVVRYGFDEIEIRLEEISKFEDEVSDLEDKYDVSFSEEVKEGKKQEIKRKLVDEFLAELEKVDQFVLVEGKYSITYENNKQFRLTYEHPINEHLTYMPQEPKVLIVCFLNKDDLESRYRTQLERMASKGAAIPVNIFGKVFMPIDRGTNNWELIIIPFAIY